MVKCENCGFLSVRSAANSELIEASSSFRQGGVNKPPAIPRPVCLIGAQPIEDEYTQLARAEQKDFRGVMLKVIGKERDCQGFTSWQQGSSPKEHKEMIDEREARDWRRKIELEDREYRDRQRLEDQEREERRQEKEVAHREEQRRSDTERWTKQQTDQRERDRQGAERWAKQQTAEHERWTQERIEERQREKSEEGREAKRFRFQVLALGVAIPVVLAIVQIVCALLQVYLPQRISPPKVAPSSTAAPQTPPAKD
jgi:hypothetical protein